MCGLVYRGPLTSVYGTVSTISFSSASERAISAAFMFSSMRAAFELAGMGTTSSPCASTHASASCAGVHPFFFASSANLSASATFASKFSGRYRPHVPKPPSAGPVRQSLPPPMSSFLRCVAVRSPRASGEYGTMPMPSSRASGTMSSSRSRAMTDHSYWSAVIGQTACARRTSSGECSLRPTCLILPSAISSFMASMDFSMSVFGSER
mmetsp:Transcript_42077/g.94964  ORF Transcript_42077/g.94964 Transcript_42077/m.94964 type:complete len:209 (-) Transcript_42077:495-1121(-)